MGQVLNLMAFVVFATTLFMRSVDPVIPQIAEGFNITPTTAAMLSTGFTLPYALIQPVLGALADMFSKTRLIAPSACLLSALPRLRAVSRRTSKRSWSCSRACHLRSRSERRRCDTGFVARGSGAGGNGMDLRLASEAFAGQAVMNPLITASVMIRPR
jgi:Major Facilitator Superfamily